MSVIQYCTSTTANGNCYCLSVALTIYAAYLHSDTSLVPGNSNLVESLIQTIKDVRDDTKRLLRQSRQELQESRQERKLFRELMEQQLQESRQERKNFQELMEAHAAFLAQVSPGPPPGPPTVATLTVDNSRGISRGGDDDDYHAPVNVYPGTTGDQSTGIATPSAQAQCDSSVRKGVKASLELVSAVVSARGDCSGAMLTASDGISDIGELQDTLCPGTADVSKNNSTSHPSDSVREKSLLAIWSL